MSSTANGANVPIKSRRFLRANLRQATLILPKTGERVKRTVTFGNSPGLDGSADIHATNECAPLLGRSPSNRQTAKPSNGRSTLRRILARWQVLLLQGWTFAKSKTGRGVLKCSIAYFLGSLATFVPAIASLLGQQDGKHMVATITVYFHPARSQGSMFEAILCAAVAFIYAVLVCFSSMGVSMFFGRTLNLLWLGHLLVLVVFCGGGLGFVGWAKQHLGHPLVNISCSLTSLAIITVLTKEGAVQAAQFSDDKVTMVLKMILMGVLATTAVSFTISPISARTELRESMIFVTDSFGDMITMITRAFLTGSEVEVERQNFYRVSEKYKKVSGALSKNLKEAKYEHYVMGREREYHIEVQLVSCMRRLAQSIGGLRSAASTQFLLVEQSTAAGGATPINGVRTPIPRSSSFSFLSDNLTLPPDNQAILTSIDEIPEGNEEAGSLPPSPQRDSLDESRYIPTANSPADMFSRFISQLGPSMKSLAVTLKQLLDELPYSSESDYRIAYNPHFSTSLSEAVSLYTRARREALSALYKTKELNTERPMETVADFEEVAASCGYFSFSLQDFANEMKVYLGLLEDLKDEIEHRPQGRTWKWLRFWRFFRRKSKGEAGNDAEQHNLMSHNNTTDVPASIPNPKDRIINVGNDDEVRSHISYTYQLWKALGVFRRDDTKFAIKVGVGAALYALPSFLPPTRPFYQHWRGEWGLLSYMLVCSMTIGASNTTGFSRFAGTCIGAVCAIVAWTISQGNPYALAVIGWLMALWTAYIIVAQGKGPMGRFIMLTYNLSALYAYSLSVKDLDDDNDEGGIDPLIANITLHRVVAVLTGCLWGLIITRLIWPISARRKFKDGLSLLWLRMGLIWKRDPVNALLEGVLAQTVEYMDIREEFELHDFLAQLEKLHSAASSEWDLRGPFPDAAYGRILKGTQSMLDAFHAMNVVISKDPASKGEIEILRYTSSERDHLRARISHLLQVLASSMKLEYPLTEALPNTEHARDRLLAKIFKYRKEKPEAKDEDFGLLYAYALVTGQLSTQIAEVSREIEKLFGVLNEDRLKLQ